MKINFKDKKTLYVIGGVVAVIFVFWIFIKGGGDNQTNSVLTEVASDPIELIIGREMLATLDQMRSVKLDTTFLDSDVYQNLQDFTVEIPKQPVGRRDPFAGI